VAAPVTAAITDDGVDAAAVKQAATTGGAASAASDAAPAVHGCFRGLAVVVPRHFNLNIDLPA